MRAENCQFDRIGAKNESDNMSAGRSHPGVRFFFHRSVAQRWKRVPYPYREQAVSKRSTIEVAHFRYFVF